MAVKTFTLDLLYTPAQTEIFFNSPEKYIIVTKGRRFGATRGAAQAFIEYLLNGVSPLLWGETINANTDRYFERYFLPILKKLPEEIPWNWDKLKRELNINGCIADFRSADQPHNWEGFGYKKIFLNEAGIILKDEYLYTNAILPMMLDYPDSQLIAAGVPKGMYKRDGSEHKFYALYKTAKANLGRKYKLLEYTSFDNPKLPEDEIKELEKEFMLLGYHAYEQEILGKFVDTVVGCNPFFSSFKPDKHENTQTVYQYNKPVYLSIDFNLDPFVCILAHIWRDSNGYHFHVFDEVELKGGSIPALIQVLLTKENEYPGYLRNCQITGDAMGKNRNIGEMDNASHYIKLQRGLRIKSAQFKLPANPKHLRSRGDCNLVLDRFDDMQINSKKCPNLCRDLKTVQADIHHGIIKDNRNVLEQRADFGDTFRYMVNTFLRDWIRIEEGKALRRLA